MLSARNEDHMGASFLSGWAEYDKSFENIEEYIIVCFLEIRCFNPVLSRAEKCSFLDNCSDNGQGFGVID